jgi:hypothetical protein
VAQLVAHLHGMEGVRGSSPLSSTKHAGQGHAGVLERGARHGPGTFLDTYLLSLDAASLRLEPSWPPSGGLAHLAGMDTINTTPDVIEPVLTLSELAASLVSGCPA